MQGSRFVLSSLLFFLLIALPSTIRATFPQPFYFQNVSSTGALATCTISSSTAFNTYYPYKIYTSSSDPTVSFWLNQTYAGTTTQLNGTLGSSGVSNFSFVPPPSQPSAANLGDITFSANTVLTSNVKISGNIIINSGVYLYTEGYSLIVGQNLVLNGYIITNVVNNQGTGGNSGGYPGGNGGSFLLSYAGSGGAGASSVGSGGYGGNTIANGGVPSGGAGSQPSVPTINNANIITWYQNGMINYLSSAGGGGGGGYSGSSGPGGNGGSGVYGLYIQANNIQGTGYIFANGLTGKTVAYGGQGGASGGAIVIIAYKGSVSAITVNIGGGSGGSAGSGGDGRYEQYQYTTPPITLSNYLYQIKEQQGASTQVYTLTLGATMSSINGQLTFNALCTPTIQDYQNCVLFPYASNTFTSKPTRWSIASDNLISYYNLTGPNYNFANFSNANLTFMLRFNLVYSQFTPAIAFTTNAINNPITITQQPFNMLLSNAIVPANRNIANFSVFSQETFNGLSNANLTLLFSGILNGYTINKVVSNTTSNALGLYYLSIPKSNYQNPTFTYSLNASLTKPYYYAQTDTFCPTSVPFGNTTFYPLGLVDTNGSKYTFYVYTSGGGSAAGYLMQILEQKGVGTTQVQSYLLPATLPFSLPLESTGQQYAYDVLSSNCKTYYFKGSYSTPTNPIYLTLTSTSSAYIYNTTQAFGICMLKNQTGGVDHISCYGGDPAQLVYQYNLNVYNSTSVVGTTALVYARNFSGSSFSQSFTLPKNNSYSYTLYAYVYRNNDPIIILNSGWLSMRIITLAAPLFGFIAFLMFITMVLGGATTGKAIILLAFANIGMFLIALMTPIQVPLPVMVVFIILSVMAVWWDRPHK